MPPSAVNTLAVRRCRLAQQRAARARARHRAAEACAREERNPALRAMLHRQAALARSAEAWHQRAAEWQLAHGERD